MVCSRAGVERDGGREHDQRRNRRVQKPVATVAQAPRRRLPMEGSNPMIRMVDGPAVGVELAPRRAPIFLRVVQDETTGKWDVLDLPDDTPHPSETVYVYRRIEGTWRSGAGVFACTRGQGCYPGVDSGDYEHVDVVGDRFRGTDAWRSWCLSQPEAKDATVATRGLSE